MPAPPFGPDFVFQDDAALDYVDAFRHYEEIAQRGLDFEARVAQTLAFVRRHPEASPLATPDGVRKKLVPGYPYVVYYTREEDGRFWVWAVAHQRRRPGYWKGRREP